MKKTLYFFLMCVCVALVVSCGDDDSDDKGGGGNNGGGSSANMGVNNTTDRAVTGGVQQVGMSYADVMGYQNGFTDDLLAEINAYGFVGVYYGTSPSNLDGRAACSYHEGRNIYITIPHLEAGKKYYYRMVISIRDIVYKGQEIGTFTTKEVSFNGAMSATASDITFHHARLTGSVNTSSLSEKELYFQGLAYSKNKSDLSANLYQKLKNAESVYDPNLLVVPQSGSDYESFGGQYVNGDLHFMISSNLETTATLDPGTTFYYCPLLIIGGKSVAGTVQEATLRSIPDQSGFVDLGLNCCFDARNLGATSVYDVGKKYWLSEAKSLASQQSGRNVRVPSQTDIEELKKCKIEYIDNGVLLTGPNGNQIFIPVYELDRTEVVMIGNDGLLTSTSSSSTWYGTTYTYYDFVNGELRFFTEYSSSYRYVRLVSDSPTTSGGGGGSGGGGSSSDGTPHSINDVVGTYTAYEGKYSYDDQKWTYYADYQIEITAQSGSSQYLYITNFWEGGKTVEAIFDSTTGTISIYDGQTVFTHDTYGDFEILVYDDQDYNYYSRPLDITYNTEYGYYRTPIYGLFCTSGGFYPYITYMKKNSDTASARAQNSQPQTRQKKRLGKPQPQRRRKL